MIRHGAKLVYAFAEATVPRVTVIHMRVRDAPSETAPAGVALILAATALALQAATG